MNGVDTLWNNSGRKTIFDPCPAGYKVPQASVWDALFFKAVTPSPDTTVLFNSDYTVDKSITKNWSSERTAQYHWQARFRGARFGNLYLIAGGSLDHQGNVKCVPADKAIHTRLWTATAFSPRSSSYQFGAYAACVGPSYAHQVAEFKLYDSSESTAHRFSNLYPVRCIKE